ncbi:MAG: hypothetical protein R3D68_14445 [Hyphomicrobiaceae bacterium]
MRGFIIVNAHSFHPAYAPAAGGQPSVYHQFAPLTLVPDLDTLPALAPEREALWSALEKTSFLTTEEKRALAGFSPARRADAQWASEAPPKSADAQWASEAPPKSADAQWASEARIESLKFSPGQPRVPSGQPGGGQWTDGSGGTGRDVLPIARRPGGGKRPSQTQPPSSSEQPRHKKPKAGQSGKEGATDVPDWVRQSGDRPLLGEDGRDFAKRVLDRKYPKNKGRHDVGPKSEFNQIKKWADRHFE